MREPHGRTSGFDVWCLGTILYSATKGGDFLFGHDGGNDPAINSTARINPENGDAIIVSMYMGFRHGAGGIFLVRGFSG